MVETTIPPLDFADIGWDENFDAPGEPNSGSLVDLSEIDWDDFLTESSNPDAAQSSFAGVNWDANFGEDESFVPVPEGAKSDTSEKAKESSASEPPFPVPEEVPVAAATSISEAKASAESDSRDSQQGDARDERGDFLNRTDTVKAVADAQAAVAADPGLQSAESKQALWNVAKVFGVGAVTGAAFGVALDVIGGYFGGDRATSNSIRLIIGGLSALSTAGIHIFAESVKNKEEQFPKAARLAREIADAYLVPAFAGVAAGLLAETGVGMVLQPDALSSMGTAAGDAASKAQEFVGGVVRNAQDAVSGNSGEPSNLVESASLEARQAAEVAKQAQHAVAQTNASDTKEMAESAKAVAELAVRQAAEAAANATAKLVAQQAAEAVRLAVLQQGQTVAELLPNMAKHTPHEVIYNWIGDVPHRGEIANALVRSFQTAGVDLNSLHQGTVQEAANVLSAQFTSADRYARQMGVPYSEGGLWATRALAPGGVNSAVAKLIETANLENVAESAAKVWDTILRPVVGAAIGK